MITPIPNLNMQNHVAAELTRLHQEIERLRAALAMATDLIKRTVDDYDAARCSDDLCYPVGEMRTFLNQQTTENK